ncbi:MAG: FeS-binding protein [Dehalococcoidia bacterium]|nr:FeS-binding protein [Dehalococcoidia bacterium]
MASRRVKFTYTAALIPDPVIYELGKRFPIVTNIRRADVRETFGWVILEMIGDDADIDRGLEWVRGKGIRVDPAGGDVVEG